VYSGDWQRERGESDQRDARGGQEEEEEEATRQRRHCSHVERKKENGGSGMEKKIIEILYLLIRDTQWLASMAMGHF
jgi:hypothetical protein